MERYNRNTKTSAENPKVEKFINELIAVCKKHGLSLSHEDDQGSFVVEPYSDSNIEWLNDASTNLDE